MNCSWQSLASASFYVQDLIEENSMKGICLRYSMAVVAGGALVLMFLLSWRQFSWMREPAWVKNAPSIPAQGMFAWIAGPLLPIVKQGKFARNFMHADQPDLVRLNNGIVGGIFRDLIMCKDPKICREVLEETNTSKPERGYRAFRRLTGYKGSYDFLSSHSHKDKLYARTRTPAYERLMARTLKYYDTLFVDTARKVVDRCGTFPDGKFNVVHEMHSVATSLITSIAFDEQSEKFDKNLFECAVWIIGDMIARPQNNSMTFLDRIPTPRNFKLWKKQKLLIETIQAMVESKRKNPGDDVISKLLENPLNTDADLLGVLSIFFFAGFDTTSNTMSMILYHLAHNPDVQERARRDVFECMGRKNQPKLHKLMHMQYLNAVIKETLRMFPTVPMVTREVTEEHEDGICPRFKEKSAFGLVINFFGLHYNPKGWNRSNEFVPERWIDKSIDEDRDPDQRMYCPFAIGKRACLGRQFAYIEMLTVISLFLQKYRIIPSKSGNSSVSMHEGGTLVVDDKLELALEPYSPSMDPPTDVFRHLTVEPEYTVEEVARHHTLEDLWMIIDDGVYNLTRYVKMDKGGRHPGGLDILVAYGGTDASSEFDFIGHSKFARRLLSRYRIGKVQKDDMVEMMKKEDITKHVRGPDAARGRRRRKTVPVMESGYGDQPPLRNFK